MHSPVQALLRGLATLSALNEAGPSTVLDLAKRTGLNRTTLYRLLSTLEDEGFVIHDKNSGLFSLTPKVRRLSDSLTTRDVFSQAALPPMLTLLHTVNWPSDFAVFDRGSLLIKETTHPFSPFSIHRAMIGKRRSLLNSALGRSMLAAASPTLRRDMLEITAASDLPDSKLSRDLSAVAVLVARVKRDGYAWSVGESEPRISAIALPVFNRRNVAGSINLIFFRSAMTPATAASRYLPQLRAAAEEIGTRLSGWADPTVR